jgi:hypothetical protein
MSIIEADIAVESLVCKVLKHYEKAIVAEDKIKEMIINGVLSKNINSLDNEIRLALPSLDENVLGNWKAKCHRKRNKDPYK